MKIRIESCSLQGGRPRNQDRWVTGCEPRKKKETWETEDAPLLTAVLDGVGSLSHSEVASEMAAHTLADIFYTPIGKNDSRTVSERLEEACRKADSKVEQINRCICHGLAAAATLTAAAFAEGKMFLMAVGDSPAYFWRNGTLTRLFEVQHDKENPRMLLDYLGGASPAEFTQREMELEKGDTIVLCSDGICRPGRLKWMLRLGVSADAIAGLSTWWKNSDNATIIIVRVEKL